MTDTDTGASAPLFHPTPRPAEPETQASSRGHKRSTISRAQRAVLASVLVCAFVMGMLSPGEPTGHAVIDAVYRGGFVALVALAGSRARRWSVISSSAIVTAGSIGLGLLFGAVALLMSVLIVGRDIRNRIYGACVGTFVGLACLRLRIEWFLGASALVATVASGLMLWSGYRVSRSRPKRVVRWSLALGALVMVVGVGMAGYQAIAFASPLEDGVRSTVDGVASVQNGETVRGAEQFSVARDTFSDVAGRAGAWWLFPSRMVPFVAQNLDAVVTLSESGASLTEAAERTASEVDYSTIRREGGGVDLELLARFRDPVVEASRRLADAAALVDDLDSPWLVAPIADRLDDFDEKVTDLRSQTDLAADALTYGPALFGGEGERRYLVLLGNPAEARDIGGHIGNWAELTMTDGAISLVEVGTPLELSQPELDNAVEDRGNVPPSLLGMRPATFPQNWGASLSFPIDAEVAAQLFQAKTGRRIDGVLYADPFAMAAMLSITGPVGVPGLDKQVDSTNAVRFLTHDQYVDFPSESEGDTAVTELVRTVFDRLTKTTLPGPAQLGASFGPLVKDGRLRMVSLHDVDHPLLARLALDYGFVPVEGDDLLAVVTRNANPSKIDSYLSRDITYDVRWDPETGSIGATVTVVLRNDAPAGGLPPYLIGNSGGRPDGTNITDLAIVTPFEATSATVDGVETVMSPLRDDNVWRHTVRTEVPPGGERRVVVALEGEVSPGARYRLRFSGQPLVNDDSTRVVVTADGQDLVGGPGIDVADGQATITLRHLGQTILTLRANS